ncbi:MAG: GspH/FimT family pseudopilin [Gemmatimonadota bacterium]
MSGRMCDGIGNGGPVRPGRRRAALRASGGGFTLLELAVVVALVGLMALAGVAGFRSVAGAHALAGAARAARGQFALARSLAVTGRANVWIRPGSTGDLLVTDSAGTVLGRAPLGSGGSFGLDSIRLRPGAIRFNARGQAAPGSLTLYRGRRAVRLISNFLGRVRQVPLAGP